LIYAALQPQGQIQRASTTKIRCGWKRTMIIDSGRTAMEPAKMLVNTMMAVRFVAPS